MFLANYGDVVTDAPLDQIVAAFRESGKVAGLIAARPAYSFHVVRADAQGEITDIADAHDAGIWINGGYYMFRREIFDYVRGNEDLVEEPFTRLVAEDQLAAFRARRLLRVDGHAQGPRDPRVARGAGQPALGPLAGAGARRVLTTPGRAARVSPGGGAARRAEPRPAARGCARSAGTSAPRTRRATARSPCTPRRAAGRRAGRPRSCR